MGSSRSARTAERQRGARDVGDLDERPLIIDALRRLSAGERAAIRRSHYSRWTTSHIAADLQLPESVVKETLHDALRALDLNVRHIRASRAQQV